MTAAAFEDPVRIAWTAVNPRVPFPQTLGERVPAPHGSIASTPWRVPQKTEEKLPEERA